MENGIKTLTDGILERITPKEDERAKVNALSHKIEQRIIKACESENIVATVRVEGSVAKDTWVSGTPDVDVFIRLPASIPRKNLGEVGLKIAKKAAGTAEQLERYAEHPYLEISMDGYHIDIVPCYDVKLDKRQSATDRTPYHTDYIKTHLKQSLHGDVRLLKQFMHGINVYGAEIRIGGFSGYLCELLVINFGSFTKTIEAFAKFNKRMVIDSENYYKDRQRDLNLVFNEPLVVIDPVDKGRNVASAVKPQKLYEFIAASRAFLKQPKEEFFFPPTTKPLPSEVLKKEVTMRGSDLIFLIIKQKPTVPDVLWGQLYRTQRSLSQLLQLHDFNVLKDTVWSNEKNLSIFTFELEQKVLPNNKKHTGPPLEKREECEKFLAKYLTNKQVISGPYIKDQHWIVQAPRKINDATTLLKSKLEDGGKKVGVSELIAEAIKTKYEIQNNNEILNVYLENKDFAEFLTEFLSGKPFWLKTH